MLKKEKQISFCHTETKHKHEIYPYFETTAKQIVESKIINRKMTPRGFKLI